MFDEDIGNCLDNLANADLFEMLNSAELQDTFNLENVEENNYDQ